MDYKQMAKNPVQYLLGLAIVGLGYMHNHVTGKYATKLRLVYEAQIVSVIGQAEFDNAIEINHADPEWNVQKHIYSPI